MKKKSKSQTKSKSQNQPVIRISPVSQAECGIEQFKDWYPVGPMELPEPVKFDQTPADGDLVIKTRTARSC
jgi:hypothetical protein